MRLSGLLPGFCAGKLLSLCWRAFKGRSKAESNHLINICWVFLCPAPTELDVVNWDNMSMVATYKTKQTIPTHSANCIWAKNTSSPFTSLRKRPTKGKIQWFNFPSPPLFCPNSGNQELTVGGNKKRNKIWITTKQMALGWILKQSTGKGDH